jgi:hypothetical protein
MFKEMFMGEIVSVSFFAAQAAKSTGASAGGQQRS